MAHHFPEQWHLGISCRKEKWRELRRGGPLLYQIQMQLWGPFKWPHTWVALLFHHFKWSFPVIIYIISFDITSCCPISYHIRLFQHRYDLMPFVQPSVVFLPTTHRTIYSGIAWCLRQSCHHQVGETRQRKVIGPILSRSYLQYMYTYVHISYI